MSSSNDNLKADEAELVNNNQSNNESEIEILPSVQEEPKQGEQPKKKRVITVMDDLMKQNLNNEHNFLEAPLPPGCFVQCRVNVGGGALSKKIEMTTENGQFLLYGISPIAPGDERFWITRKSKFSPDGKKLGTLNGSVYGQAELILHSEGDEPHKPGFLRDLFSGPIDENKLRQDLAYITFSEWGGDHNPQLRKVDVTLPRLKNNKRTLIRPVTVDDPGIREFHSCSAFSDAWEQELVRFKALNNGNDLTEAQIKELKATTFVNEDVTNHTIRRAVWNPDTRSYSIAFEDNRVQKPSVKNHQLLQEDNLSVMLQLGRVSKTQYTLDFHHPLSPLQAFGIALAQFAYKKKLI